MIVRLRDSRILKKERRKERREKKRKKRKRKEERKKKKERYKYFSASWFLSLFPVRISFFFLLSFPGENIFLLCLGFVRISLDKVFLCYGLLVRYFLDASSHLSKGGVFCRSVGRSSVGRLVLFCFLFCFLLMK